MYFCNTAFPVLLRLVNTIKDILMITTTFFIFYSTRLSCYSKVMTMNGTKRIIGLDPGLRNTGWGVIDVTGNRLQYVAHGTATSDSKTDLATRLIDIYNKLIEVIDEYQPDEAGIEEVFVNKNPGSTLKLGMARGVVLLAPKTRGLIIGEYSANKVKKSVVGAGHAGKDQVEMMVKTLLPGCQNATKDAADALAVAICHSHHSTIQKIWAKL